MAGIDTKNLKNVPRATPIVMTAGMLLDTVDYLIEQYDISRSNRYMNEAEACEYLHVSRSKFRSMIHEQGIEAYGIQGEKLNFYRSKDIEGLYQPKIQ